MRFNCADFHAELSSAYRELSGKNKHTVSSLNALVIARSTFTLYSSWRLVDHIANFLPAGHAWRSARPVSIRHGCSVTLKKCVSVPDKPPAHAIHARLGPSLRPKRMRPFKKGCHCSGGSAAFQTAHWAKNDISLFRNDCFCFAFGCFSCLARRCARISRSVSRVRWVFNWVFESEE